MQLILYLFLITKKIMNNITEKNAIAIHKFNQHVASDERVQQTLLTVRDGLSLIRKL